MPQFAHARYRSYLLRIWQEPDGGQWRGSLHSVQDDSILYFAGLEALAIFLLGGADPAPGQNSDKPQAPPRLGS